MDDPLAEFRAYVQRLGRLQGGLIVVHITSSSLKRKKGAIFFTKWLFTRYPF